MSPPVSLGFYRTACSPILTTLVFVSMLERRTDGSDHFCKKRRHQFPRRIAVSLAGTPLCTRYRLQKAYTEGHPPDCMGRRQVILLSGVGALCLLISILGGGLSTGYNVIDVSALLLRAGLIYLTLGVVTYVLNPIRIRGAVLGALGASGLVFVLGSAVMYHDLALTYLPYGTPLTTPLLVNTQAQFLFVTLPISAGYVSGVLARTNRRSIAYTVLLGAVLVAWFGGSWVSGPSANPGFTLMFFLIGTMGTTLLAMLSVTVMSGDLDSRSERRSETTASR